MPEAKTAERARKAQRHGKSPTTAAGEFVREEIEHVREGKHGARSSKQAIAIGLSKARRAGIKLKTPKRGTVSARTRRQAARDRRKGSTPGRTVSPRRSRASTRALQREGRQAASPRALSAQARRANARRKGAAVRRSNASSSSRRGASTKRRGGRSARSRQAST
jgi:hypothetical protein